MKRIITLLMVFLFIFLNNTKILAYIVVPNHEGINIYYSVSAKGEVTVTKSDNDSEKYSGDIYIPKVITYNGTDYDVTNVAIQAFKGCVELHSVSLPNSIKTIGEEAFYGCTNLKTINIPLYLKSIGKDSFYGCNLESVKRTIISFKEWSETGDQVEYDNYYSNPLNSSKCQQIYNFGDQEMFTINIPDGVESIIANAFQKCANVERVILPNSIKSIGVNAFEGCTGLKSLHIASVDSFLNIKYESTYVWGNTSYYPGSNPLTYAHHLYVDGKLVNNLIVPTSIRDINSLSLSGGVFDSVILPPSVKYLGEDAFLKTNISALYIFNPDIVWYYVDGTSTRLSYQSALKDITGKIYSFHSFNIPDKVKSIKPQLEYFGIDCAESYIRGLKLCYNSDEYISDLCSLNNVYVDDEEINFTKDFPFIIDGLMPNQKGFIKSKYKCFDVEVIDSIPYETKKMNVKLNLEKTQTTITVKNINYNSDITSKVEKTYFKFKGASYETGDKITNLIPNSVYYIILVIVFDDELEYIESGENIFTNGLSPSIQFVTGPTTIEAKGEYIVEDCHVEKAYFESYGTDKSYLTLNGLTPDHIYEFKFVVETKEGCKQQITKYISTDKLQLTSENPKIVSVGNAIVSAKTNIQPSEKNIGFEWRRRDWTEEFASKKGEAYVFDGTMEGSIINLNKDYLWICRPYYYTENGNYYYGTWVGIDPIDYSYFEPIIHTYDNAEVHGNTAFVNAYVIPGTDELDKFGFIYWKNNSESRQYVQGNKILTKETIYLNETSMTAEISDLDYESTYCYVAFATTTNGKTFWGEERSFTTSTDVTGIKSIRVENNQESLKYEVARFNIKGQKIITNKKGINIIRLSDGSTRKIFVR